MVKYLSQSLQGAITKCHRLRGLKTYILGSGSPSTGGQHGWVLMRALSLTCRNLPSRHALTSQGEKGLSGITNVLIRALSSWLHLILVTSKRLVSKYHHIICQGFITYILGGRKHSIHNNCCKFFFKQQCDCFKVPLRSTQLRYFKFKYIFETVSLTVNFN